MSNKSVNVNFVLIIGIKIKKNNSFYILNYLPFSKKKSLLYFLISENKNIKNI